MHILAISLYATFAGVCYFAISLIWDAFFSPTRAIPGPRASRISRLWFYRKVEQGSFHHENIDLHERYGPVVRLAPGFFSISAPDKTIYGIGSKFPKGDWYQGWKVTSSLKEANYT